MPRKRRSKFKRIPAKMKDLSPDEQEKEREKIRGHRYLIPVHSLPKESTDLRALGFLPTDNISDFQKLPVKALAPNKQAYRDTQEKIALWVKKRAAEKLVQNSSRSPL